MKKIIGITPRLVTVENVEKEFVNRRYINPLLERGFQVLMLTLDNKDTEDLLELCDAFLITGGSDINPKYFGEENNGQSKNVNSSLDVLDKQVVEHATKTKKPLLGICRGHQAINIFSGGTLFQNIGDKHNSVSKDHEVTTIPNRLLKFNKEIKTNSYHHQAVKKIAPGFIEIATHLDGTNEAIIHEKLPIIGIQWHPEIHSDSEVSKIIFDSFKDLINNK
ncbi:MAG TPA: type 1 glutamine amidotransferase [Acholeplasmataceae bacterium]|nr:type 1 glutamine amidotransferase [Acholeplasmataceae bacterium]